MSEPSDRECERCLLCGQKMRGVPQDPHAATAMALMLIEGQKVAVEQAKHNYEIAAAVRWCVEHWANVDFSRYTGGAPCVIDCEVGMEGWERSEGETLPEAVTTRSRGVRVTVAAVTD